MDAILDFKKAISQLFKGLVFETEANYPQYYY